MRNDILNGITIAAVGGLLIKIIKTKIEKKNEVVQDETQNEE